MMDPELMKIAEEMGVDLFGKPKKSKKNPLHGIKATLKREVERREGKGKYKSSQEKRTGPEELYYNIINN